MKFPLLTATLACLTTYQWSPQYASAATCIITYYNAEDIRRAVSECTETTIDGIEVPAGETLTLNLRPSTNLIFSGRITWAYREWKGPLLRISGISVKITGAPGHVLDGRGDLWWDGKGEHGGKEKPTLFEANQLINSQISNIKVKNSPGHVFYINQCSGVPLKGVTIDNSAGNSRGALNTKAFNIRTSSDIRMTSCTILNQDDCLNILSGTNIKFLQNHCSGGGVTIGPVGSVASVSDFTINNCQITNSDNGLAIKTVYGATGGSVSHIMWDDISMTNIHKYGIVIEGDYQNGIPTGTPTAGVPITNLKINNINGRVDSSGVNVYILVEDASNWIFSGIGVTGGTKTQRCIGIPPDAGISC